MCSKSGFRSDEILLRKPCLAIRTFSSSFDTYSAYTAFVGMKISMLESLSTITSTESFPLVLVRNLVKQLAVVCSQPFICTHFCDKNTAANYFFNLSARNVLNTSRNTCMSFKILLQYINISAEQYT